MLWYGSVCPAHKVIVQLSDCVLSGQHSDALRPIFHIHLLVSQNLQLKGKVASIVLQASRV